MKSSFEAYRGKLPVFVPVDVTDKIVASVARKLFEVAGTWVTYLVILQHWLLRFGYTRAELRKIFGEFGYWMANGRPSLVAYRALVSGRLIGLDKCFVVRSVRVRKTWLQMLAKCVLAVIGEEAKEACGKEQLCRGLEAGVMGWIQAVQILWLQHAQEEYWGFPTI